MSLRAGMDHCDADVLVMMDSDLQHPPELIPQLLAEYENGNDIVYTIRQSSEDVGIFRGMASRIFYKAPGTSAKQFEKLKSGGGLPNASVVPAEAVRGHQSSC